MDKTAALMTASRSCNASRITRIPVAGMRGLAALQKHYRGNPHGRKPRRVFCRKISGEAEASVAAEYGGEKA
jgi:hypothetical protein